jgi:signal transduction histidine kinase
MGGGRNQINDLFGQQEQNLQRTRESVRFTITDGRVWADANEPRGSVFRFTLPGAV